MGSYFETATFCIVRQVRFRWLFANQCFVEQICCTTPLICRKFQISFDLALVNSNFMSTLGSIYFNRQVRYEYRLFDLTLGSQISFMSSNLDLYATISSRMGFKCSSIFWKTSSFSSVGTKNLINKCHAINTYKLIILG